MKEILGANLKKCFKELKIKAKKTYCLNNKYCEYEVWEMSDNDFEVLSNIPNSKWKESWGWWRFSEGSNMGQVFQEYIINGKKIMTWDGKRGEDDQYLIKSRSYDNLLEYFCDEIGASTETNICALATDLAKQNNMKMSDLFSIYQNNKI